MEEQLFTQELNDADLSKTVELLCNSKAEEFRLVGYEQVTGQDIWQCVNNQYTKEGVPPLHKLVNDILSLKVTTFMNFMTISAYRGSTFE
ncbi:post-transcriptional regulator [Paenibacillus sediminis]|uniref:Post-transcriptional regulator n=1 Tax=Paenibacillus sediminis TaxID=664909 RepID=A0ABS4GY24_9BACL|nr:post-transcriptional regulator [Paenibacillus sediminis]MBP1935156.1 hypothetical protein [Paenibacillus sediminis]